jgi:hypothetical protein
MPIVVNILDVNNNIIGTLTVPAGTSQEVINALLAQYTIPSPAPAIIQDIDTITLTDTSSATTSSATPTALPGMSTTPQAGTYVVNFSGSINTAGTNATGAFGIYVNGALLPETNRTISCNVSLLGGLVTLSVNAIGVGTCTGTQVTLGGTDTLSVMYASTNGGTIGFNEKVLTLIQVA